MVDALGTNIPMVFSGVFAGGAVLAAIAGVIAAPFLSVYSGMGIDALMDRFVVIVIGGLREPVRRFYRVPDAGEESHSFGVLVNPRSSLLSFSSCSWQSSWS